jgi:predicted dehydrogenase
MAQFRVGLIGCGKISLNRHAPTLRDMEGVQVVGLADPVEANREEARQMLGLPETAAFADHRSLLDLELDYVILATPPKFRRPIVADCVRAGVHVLSEKPLATVPAEAQAMIEIMEQAGLLFGMVHNYLYFPEFVLARKLIDQGAIGQLRHVTMQWLGMGDFPGSAAYKPHWRHELSDSGGGILMDMLHAVYMVAFFMGSPIRAASAVADNLSHPGDTVEDFALVHYLFDSGYATINMWWGRGPNSFEFSGDEGQMLYFHPDHDTWGKPVEDFILLNDEGRQLFSIAENGQGYAKSFAGIHADFIEAVRTGRQPIAPAKAGLAALEATLAAYASAGTGRVVPLPLAKDDPVYQQGVLGLRALPLWADSPLHKRGVFGL